MATQPIRKLPSNKTYATVTLTTVGSGQSDVIDLGGHIPCSIEMSTAWTTANLTFLGAVSSTLSMSSVYVTSAAVELTYVTSASYVLALDPTPLQGLRYIQLRSGSGAAPVAQAATRTINLGLNSLEPTK